MIHYITFWCKKKKGVKWFIKSNTINKKMLIKTKLKGFLKNGGRDREVYAYYL